MTCAALEHLHKRFIKPCNQSKITFSQSIVLVALIDCNILVGSGAKDPISNEVLINKTIVGVPSVYLPYSQLPLLV
jgi:energy-converting hydrogenase Eha subunit E